MTEYSRMAKGFFKSTGFAQIINLPFQPDYVTFTNYTLANTNATSQNIISAQWDVNMGQGNAVVEGYNASPTLIYDVVGTNGISTFAAGQLLQYGPIVQHGGSPVSDFSITATNPAVITTVGNHGLQTGDVVIFSNLSQTSTTGMQQFAGIPFEITRTAATTFSIAWNASGSNYTAFNTSTSTGNIGSYKKVLYPDLYFPGDKFISALALGTLSDGTSAGTGVYTKVTTTAQHQFHVGQEIGFHIPFPWGTIQLNELPNVLIPGSPIYGYIVNVLDAQNFVVSINSTSYTAFNVNQPFASYPGLNFPQVVAVGDVNTGGNSIFPGSQLYPPPQYSYAALDDSTTINGPAIKGSYVNNTSQGFIIGAGAGRVLTTADLVGASGNMIFWRAFLHDMSIPV